MSRRLLTRAETAIVANDLDRLQKENERLRNAVRILGEIADACTFDDLSEICDYCRCARASSPLSSNKLGGE